MAGDGDERLDLLARMSRANPTAVVIAAAGLFLLVLILPEPAGGVLVLAIVAGLVLLLTRTWRVLPGPQRVLRLLVIALLVAAAVRKLM
jgi:hypothetical protein